MIRESFAAFGITADPPVMSASVGRRRAFSYSLLHAAEFARPDEVARFIWANAAHLGIPTDKYLDVEDVQPSVRVGPDGFVVREVVATYIQLIDGTGHALMAIARAMGGALHVPEGIDPGARIQLQGGGTLIFDDTAGSSSIFRSLSTTGGANPSG